MEVETRTNRQQIQTPGGIETALRETALPIKSPRVMENTNQPRSMLVRIPVVTTSVPSLAAAAAEEPPPKQEPE